MSEQDLGLVQVTIMILGFAGVAMILVDLWMTAVTVRDLRRRVRVAEAALDRVRTFGEAIYPDPLKVELAEIEAGVIDTSGPTLTKDEA